MTSLSQIPQEKYPTQVVDGDRESWYAVQTRARHERVVVQRFRDKGLTTFLPLVTEVRRWSVAETGTPFSIARMRSCVCKCRTR